MALGRLSCMPEEDGTILITRRSTPEGTSAPQVLARVYDRDWALLLAKSPDLLDALQWLRELLWQEACQCQPGVKGCVLCVTDSLLAELEPGKTS